MGSLFLQKGLCVCIYLFFSLGYPVVGGVDGIDKGIVVIDGNLVKGSTDENFICATLDWWPPEKCDYGTCAWDHASFLNLNLSNTILLNAIKAFSPLTLRLGGTLQDKVIYQTEDQAQPCVPFVRNTSDWFGFSQGCFPLSRWDELNKFFKKASAIIYFGLNALNGRTIHSDGLADGDWDSSNAESFIHYTISKGYVVHGWEYGNELGLSASINTTGQIRVEADQYASDTIALNNILGDAYENFEPKPLILSPGGFFDPEWFSEYFDKTRTSLNVTTHHIYNLGPGSADDLVEKILNSSYLDEVASTFSGLQNLIRTSGTPAFAWVGEAGGAYNSGRDRVTNTFIFSFWYLDQLGMSATYDTKKYCRQTLIGGNYGLLNTTTFEPNPDYYSALLWHRLMGKNALSTSFLGTEKIRAYAHCAKQSKGITLLLINLDGNTTIQAKVDFNGTTLNIQKQRQYNQEKGLIRLPKGSETAASTREEYHLTAKDGDILSQTMLLNGKALTVDQFGNIPPLMPKFVKSTEPIKVAPFSIVFAHIPYVLTLSCYQVSYEA